MVGMTNDMTALTTNLTNAHRQFRRALTRLRKAEATGFVTPSMRDTVLDWEAMFLLDARRAAHAAVAMLDAK